MPKFSYTASKDGKTVHGTAEAVNKKELIKSIRKSGAKPVSIHESKSSQKSKFGLLDTLLGQKKVKVKDLAVFTRQLSTMISAGVPMNRSLTTLQKQTNHKYFQSIIADVSKEIEGGKPLADAFAKYPDVFSDIYVNMVRAGEAGGILDEILNRLAMQLERDSSMRKKVKSAMAYPVVIMTITVIAFFGIMLFVMPKLSKIIKDIAGEDAQLPVYTRAMLAISEFMQANALIIIALLFVASIAVRYYIKTPKGKYKFHALLLRTPVVKVVIVKVAIARFARTFSSLMAAGVGILDALEVTGGAMGNKVIEKELADAAKEVRNGKQLSEALQNSQYFPTIVGQMLAVGEESGQIDTVLIKLADFYEEEVATTVDAISSIIEPVMIVVLGSIVGVIAASVMGPIASLSKNIQQ
jgi:type IV pilus assembly protein PilC